MSQRSTRTSSPPETGLLPGQAGFLLLQEKWVLFILDTLAEGPIGFNALTRVARRVNPVTLSERLGLLQQEGLVEHTVHPTQKSRGTYQLTDSGRALLPILAAIKQWAEQNLRNTPGCCCD